MGNKRSLLGKGRVITSAVLAASMVFSGMSASLPTGTVYAATEGSADASTDSSSEEVATSSSSASTGSSAEEKKVVTEESSALTGSGEDDSSEANSASSASSEASNEEASEEASSAASASSEEEVTVTEDSESSEETVSDEYTVDVWDFGAEQLSGVNNQLTVDIINGFYDSSITAGSTGVPIAGFTAGDLSFADGGYTGTHRLRSTNEALTRYDSKSKTYADGNTYTGFLYSNKSSTDTVYVSIEMKADEQVTFYAGSNGNAALYYFVNEDDATDVQTGEYSGTNGVEPLTFYAKQDGTYDLYCSNEKLVVARVIRTQANYVNVSGTVNGFEDTEGVSLVFENQSNGKVTTVDISDDTYSVSLASGYTYDVSLDGADAYVITDGAEVTVGDEDTTLDITVEGVELVSYAGEVTGIAEEDFESFVSAAEFTFSPQDENSVYVPKITLTAGESAITYEVTLQNNVTYDVAVADKEDTAAVNYAAVEDYNLLTEEIVVDGAEKDFAIEFEAKPVYNITIVPSGATTDDLAEAIFTFTRLNTEDYTEDGYVYEFTGTEGITLRDGQYVVEVSNSGAFVQQLTSNLIVNGADVSKTIVFSSDITEWDFSDSAFVSKFSNVTSGTYNGLSWTNGRSHNSTYLYSGAGTISVPVKGSCQIQVIANYQYSYYFASEDEASVNVKTGSTSQNDTFTYNYTGDEGTFDITVLGSSYITKIATVYQTDYVSEITVGSSDDADYATISEALDAVRLMDREDGERVTISIEPGDYEEMLVIDVADVTLKNASENPTNTLTNSGVDIDENAVRITWYYGHGYTYYSMGSDYKYDADVLAVNKENGYASVVNPGSGTGTYWNATVVVSASGFEAENIIFENSFNQYMSKKAAEDVIVAQSGAKEGSVARSDMEAGDTTVQNKSYVERAAALALTASATESYFENCRIIGRQDTLYGAQAATAAFYDCAIYGGTDYIFGGMTAVFAKCDLVLNTSENANDVAYITAAQQTSSSTRGYLMYNCTVTSTTPGVDTASSYTSKPGQFGRPWQANTSEVVFFDTVVETTNWTLGSDSKYAYDADSTVSLIQPAGWNTTLGGESGRCVEYGTYEVSGEDNSASRVSWALQPETAVCSDGTAISVEAFLGDWDPFTEHENDMTIEFPDGTTEDAPVADETDTEETTTEFTLESSDLTAFSAGTKADGDTESAGTDDFFTIIYSAKSKVDSSTKTWDDGYTSSQRINFGGVASLEKNAVKFTTEREATVKIWWVEGGDDNREITILNSAGETVATTSEGIAKNAVAISTLSLEEAGTYYLGSVTGNNYIFKIEVTQTGSATKAPRGDWSEVASPEITSVALDDSDANNIVVTVTGDVSYDGADSVVVAMTDEDGNVTSAKSSKETTEHTLTFTPDASGVYTFTATLVREDEEDLVGNSAEFDFTLPLTTVTFVNAVNQGAGAVKVKFNDSVKEADAYELTITGSEEVVSIDSTEDGGVLYHIYSGLTIGETYTVTAIAVRGEDEDRDESDPSTIEFTVTSEEEEDWAFSAFGQGVSTSTNKATVNDDGSVTVASTGGKGKLVPASTDGLAFYYATIPASKNFTLSATVTVDSWTYSNGQEGFGLMAADSVGVNGDSSVFWNNSYMASATKVEYYYDLATGEVTDDTSASKITMKIGIGSQEKVGVSQDNIDLLKANDTATILSDFSSTMTTLETSCGASGTGTYNIVGNETSGNIANTTVDNPVTELKLTIRKNNTGYFVSYTDADGNTVTNKYYDTEALEQIDSDYVYAGFFASRNATATFSDIVLTMVDPEDDDAAEEQPTTYVTPSYSVVSATNANKSAYVLRYTGNADGVITITDEAGNVIAEDYAVEEGTAYDFDTTLVRGDNTFTITVTPDADFHPSDDEYQLLSSYDAVTFTHTVKYATINDGEYIYVSQDGTSDGDGSEENPVDIYTAVKYVQAGQTILLAGGEYKLSSTVTVARGIDGTASKVITMKAADEDNRPIFNFQSKCAGFVFAGDYWYVKGIDVTKSGNSLKGLQISGSYSKFEDIKAYENGNTGIQVSRYLSSDSREDWPSYDLILNCTSFSNADAGYEDADGFAAKLTVGDGIVFDGCIAYNNADDGWDLFAKVETGNIGVVTIQNCLAFDNGYGVDGTDEGNGNGFKMGGSSITGYHKLINSLAFNNKAKGIDSNSCPDIQVYHSSSFNNGNSNVAFYTNDTANTDFYAEGVMSYRSGTDVNENIKAKGTQDTTKIYGSLNFYWNNSASSNNDGLTVSDDWFVSLDAPDATVDTAYTLGDSLRNEDGSINVNGFMQLSETGIAALSAAGIDASSVAADLGGNYDAIEDVINIPGYEAEETKEDQTIEGTTSYSLSLAKNNYSLDAQLTVGDGVLSYTSSDESVVTVDEEGNLNLVAVGNAVITVTASETDNYNEATLEVSVQVNKYYEVDADGNKVFYTSATKTANGTVVDADGTYYIVNGVPYTGFRTSWGTTYYYDTETGIMAANCLKEIDGKVYYFKVDGKLVKNSSFTFEGATYRSDSTGALVTGFVTSWGSTYYYDTETYIMAANCLKEIDGKVYYFKADGKLVKNSSFTFEGVSYRSDSTGALVTGFVTSWGSTYYYDPDTYALVTGFRTIEVNGEEVLYHFNLDNGKATSGWFTEDGVTYYAYKGVVARGKVTIWWRTYNFDTVTGAYLD